MHRLPLRNDTRGTRLQIRTMTSFLNCHIRACTYSDHVRLRPHPTPARNVRVRILVEELQ